MVDCARTQRLLRGIYGLRPLRGSFRRFPQGFICPFSPLWSTDCNVRSGDGDDRGLRRARTSHLRCCYEEPPQTLEIQNKKRVFRAAEFTMKCFGRVLSGPGLMATVEGVKGKSSRTKTTLETR